MTSRGPLDGLRVLDLSSQLSGPYCAMLLGDLGADVVKVERPDEGDDGRKMGPLLAGESAPFMTFNRNKRSITVDLKVPAGLAVVHRLAAGADIALENWRPGTAARLGIGYEDLRRINPRIVYCSISGFGQTGPYAGRGGFDRIAQGMSGPMSIPLEEAGEPGDLSGGDHGSAQSLEYPQLLQKTLHFCSSIRSPHRSQKWTHSITPPRSTA